MSASNTDNQPLPDSPPSSTNRPPPPPPPPSPSHLPRAPTRARLPSNATRIPSGPPRATSAPLSLEKMLDDGPPVSPSGRVLDLGIGSMRDADGGMGMGTGNMSGSREKLDNRRTTGLDWIVPVGPSPHPKSVVERLTPTIENARIEERKYTRKATMTSYALNIAIGLQVLISALITALSAVTSGRHTQVMTSVLGGAGTIVASYLARARGSNEPELSIARTKDLQRFIRECDAFVQDHGYETGNDFDDKIDGLRSELEHLLGNGDGERKLSPV